MIGSASPQPQTVNVRVFPEGSSPFVDARIPVLANDLSGNITDQAGTDPQQGELPAPSNEATTVVVKQGDTIWGYWKAYDHARPWQDFKRDFMANNAAILADGWLHPGEVAIVRPAPPEPVAAPVLTEPGNGYEPIVPTDLIPPEPITPPASTQQPAATLPSTSAPTTPTTPVTVPPASIATFAPPAAVPPVNPQAVTQGGGYFDLWSGGVSNLLADTANRSLDVLFATDRAASVAVKGFTPNLDAAWTKAKFGDYETGGGSGKLHGWLAARGEASVSASWINDSGERMRSGTFSITVSVQQ